MTNRSHEAFLDFARRFGCDSYVQSEEAWNAGQKYAKEDIYDLLVQAFQAGQAWMLQYPNMPPNYRHMGALSHADRVMHDLKERESVE